MTLRPVRRPTLSKPNRLNPLSVLPVFFGLTGKRVVVAGGTEAAAWKAELVAAAGASVEVFAADPDTEILALVERGAAAGRLTLRRRPWDITCLSGAALAICDAANDGEAEAFACAAKAAGVPANVIDRPAFCTFQFGSIVNRSPVVVGISTNGAAPILGQAIRRRIETLLPPALADWAGIAARMRATVLERLAAGPQRRAFWERFVDLAFTNSAPDPTLAEGLIARDGSAMAAGSVTLVGAGPGDAGLLTLNAMRALQACDVILFDDLVSDDVLELARREAKRIAVGKRGARESCRQEDITALMINLAKSGRTVVRLKAGDPSIFGRSGEEIAALSEAGIAVSVVPGITSASAMAARTRSTLTHRDHAQAVTFMTGHSRHGALPDGVDVGACLRAGQTAIVYMGVRTAGEWVSRAIDSGASPTTPTLAVASISRPEEKTWSGAMRDLPGALADLGDGPILVGVGPVFSHVRVEANDGAVLDQAVSDSTVRHLQSMAVS